MIKTFLFSTALVFSLGVQAQNNHPPVSQETLKAATALRDLAANSDSAMSIVESLTTEVGPRLAGSPQDKKAREWAIAKFKALGFERVWEEPVTVNYWERISETAAVISPAPQGLSVTALGGSVSTPAGGVISEVVGFATLEELKAASAEQVSGKIVFINNRMARSRDGSGYGMAVGARSKGASIAASKGASALLIRSIGTDDHRLAHTGMMQYDPAHKKIAAAALSNPDADQIDRLLSRKQPVRLNLTIQTKDHGEVESANVVAEINGREPSDRHVLIGGHLDSWDLGTGAIDDGAGVAITMAAAKLIKDFPDRQPKNNIRVVLFAAEEIGLVGGKAYAATHAKELDRIILASESDFGAGPVWGLASAVSHRGAPAIDAMAQLMGPLGIVRDSRPSKGGPDISPMYNPSPDSDEKPSTTMGRIPVVTLLQNGERYFDIHHTADDTLDKVDPAELKQNLASWVVMAFIAADWEGTFD